MKIFDIVSEDVTALNTEPKLGKLPHEEVESVIHQWVNQEDHIELSNECMYSVVRIMATKIMWHL